MCPKNASVVGFVSITASDGLTKSTNVSDYKVQLKKEKEKTEEKQEKYRLGPSVCTVYTYSCTVSKGVLACFSRCVFCTCF